MKQIAEGCGFNYVEEYSANQYYCFQYDNSVNHYLLYIMSGQQITLSELEQLVELSNIKLSQVIEVSDDKVCWRTDMVVDFYKNQPLVLDEQGCYISFKHYRILNPHQAEIDQLEAEIKAAQAKLETLKNASK